jgi:transporter family-2 protein
MNPAAYAALIVLLAGGATALQAPTNARLAQAVHSPVNAAFISFLVGTIALGLAAAVLHVRPDGGAVRNLPPWAWLGGLYGTVFVVAAAWAVPRLGVAMTITLMVAGQLLLSLALDHYGWLGAPRNPINMGRVAGVVLVLAGVLLVRRS